MALSRSKAFILLVTPSSVTMHVHVPITRQHSLSCWQMFAFSSRSETMVYFDGIFRVLPSYALWAYSIISVAVSFCIRKFLNCALRSSIHAICTNAKCACYFLSSMILQVLEQLFSMSCHHCYWYFYFHYYRHCCRHCCFCFFLDRMTASQIISWVLESG